MARQRKDSPIHRAMERAFFNLFPPVHYEEIQATIDRMPASDQGITEAVEYATEARASHIQWAWHLENYSHSGVEVEIAGSLEEHREWIRRYDVIICALQSEIKSTIGGT